MTRGSGFESLDPWDVADDDQVFILDVSDASGAPAGPGGNVKKYPRDKLGAAINSHRYPAVQLSAPLPTRLVGAWNQNLQAFNYTHTWVHKHGTVWFLYVAYQDYQLHTHLARRKILAPTSTSLRGDWIDVDLSTKIARTITKDQHEGASVAIDGDGYAHVWVSPASGPIANAYTWLTVANPTDAQFTTLTNWATGSMSGASNTTVMSYPPIVVKRADNKLLMIHRESIGGSPSDARIHVKLYTHTGSAPAGANWTSPTAAAAAIIDGHSDAGGVRGPYFWNPIVDPLNGAHIGLFFCWRINGGTGNKSLGYIETVDSGVTWQKADGTAVTLPFTSAQYTGAAIVNDIPDTAIGLFVNQGGATFDSRGHQHVVYKQPLLGIGWPSHSWWDGSTWVGELLPEGMVNSGRPDIVRDNAGGVYTTFTNSTSGKRGAVWILDVSPGRAVRNIETPVLQFDGMSGEVPHSEIAQTALGQVIILVASGSQFADGDTTTPDADYYVPGYVLTLDANRLHEIASGAANIPRWDLIRSTAIPGFGTEIVVTQTSVAELGSIAPVLGTGGVQDDQLFMRFNGQCRVDASTTMTLKLCETTDGGVTTVSGEHPVTSTTNATHRTNWLPVQQIAGPSLRGTISLQAGITAGTGKGYLRGTLELVRLHPVEHYL